MRMLKRFFLLTLFFFLSVQGTFSKDVISSYTREKVEDFVTYRVKLKSEEHEAAYSVIRKLKDQALQNLEAHAIDLEQERCLLESLYFAEYYEHALNSTGNQKELRSEMKRLMKNNFACIDKRSSEQISDWMYQLTGDVTAYYMSRSVPATLLYGMKVKGFYEKAINANKSRSISHVCLGNWCFYAPAMFGGGKNKALKHFEEAEKCAEIAGEKYLVYISLSQINYENKNAEKTEEYLKKAIDLDLGRKDLDFIALCNKKGFSYFQYLRNRSGVDEKMSEEEKDEDDR